MIKPLLVFASTCLFTTACSMMPTPIAEMLPLPQVMTEITVNPLYANKIQLGNLLVNEQAKLLGGVVPSTVKDALQYGLLTSGYAVRNNDKAAYILDVHIMHIDAPLAGGLNMDCYPTVQYSLKDNKTNRVATETVKTHYHASFLEGDDRWHHCVGKSLRENITHYVRILSTQTPKSFK